jgi:hypothetical protein
MVKTIPNRQIITLYVTDQEHEAIKLAAQADSRSINSWCKLALLAKIQGTSAVVPVNLQAGEDVIVQKRNKQGRFVKK